ncbi:MAG TPA: SURF1 family protein [Stellaceae bacterium]|nr:SURF1 family protein [Stellaceae bacterium]
MTRRRSLLWPSVFAAGAFLALLGLGTWQVERLFWKEGLIAERHAAVTAPPSALPRSLAAAKALDYHRVRVSGRFANDHELYLGATSRDGRPGYQVITPLRLADGATVLVNRGFIPQDRKAPDSRAAGELAGDVTVTGLLRLPPQGKPHWFIPVNSPERNYWIYVDIPAMAAAAHAPNVLPFYVDADATPNPGGLPLGGQTLLDLPNDHLQYAITWYALAVGLAVIYIMFIRRRAREEAV